MNLVDFVVYAHRSNITNKLFYIGSGRGRRPYAKSGRNASWGLIAKQGYTVEILAHDLTQTEARLIEADFIRTTDGLCNSQMSTQYASIDWQQGKKTLIEWAEAGYDLPDNEHYYKLLVVFRCCTDIASPRYDKEFAEKLARLGYKHDRSSVSVEFSKHSVLAYFDKEFVDYTF